MTRVDWAALAVVAVSAVLGFRRGLIASGLSLTGVIVGAIIGARLAPHLLSSGSRSPYTPLAALIGATLGAAVLQSVAVLLGSLARGTIRFTPLRFLDSAGGLLLGGAAGLAVVWVLGAVALLLPGHPDLRQAAQRSSVLTHLNDTVSPRSLLNALARIDPFPTIAGPGAPAQAPDPGVVHNARVRAAGQSVVRVLGTACGLGVEGSGWVARRGLVVTAAHVVAGQHDTVVEPAGETATLPARVFLFDTRNDIAVLQVPGLEAKPLQLAKPVNGTPAVLIGYPGNGPLTFTPARIGRTAAVFSQDAYGHGPVSRTITSIRGRVRHGNSGGPAVDLAGRVEVSVFAARIGSDSGYGTPSELVQRDLARAAEPVDTGGCAR